MLHDTSNSIQSHSFGDPFVGSFSENEVGGLPSFSSSTSSESDDYLQYSSSQNTEGIVTRDNLPEEQVSKRGADRMGIPRSVWAVYIYLIFIVIANTCTGPIFVLYFNSREWTSSDDVFFYTIITTVGIIMPVILTPVFGFWQGRRPTKELFLFDVVLTGYGFLMMALVDNQWVFFLGYCFTRITMCQRTVRTTYILRTTNESVRTTATSLIPVCALLGAVLGPICTALCAFAPLPNDAWELGGGITLSQYTLTFWVATGLTVIRGFIVIFAFTEDKFSDRSKASTRRHSTRPALDTDQNDQEKSTTIDMIAEAQDDDRMPKKIVWLWLAYFTVIGFFIQLVFGIYLLTMQPILVNEFSFNQGYMSLWILTIALFGMIPPIVMAILVKKFGFRDRVFILISILTLGGAIIVYGIPPGEQTQVLIGSVLFFMGMILYGPSSNALFSKMLGERASALKLSLMGSAFALGPAIGSLIGGQVVLPLFGDYEFLAFTAPLAVSLVGVIIGFPYLVPKMKVTQQVSEKKGEKTPLVKS